MNVSSPCIGVCKLDGDDICIGCFRSQDEIACWTQMSDRENISPLPRLMDAEKCLRLPARVNPNE